MARPLHIEFEDMIYHVMARGNARQKICLEDASHAKGSPKNNLQNSNRFMSS